MLDGTKQLSDTSPEMDRKLNEMIAAMTPEERLLRLGSLSDFVKQAVIAGILQDFPNISEEEVRQHYVARTYGNDISSRFFNWDISKQGY